MKAWSAVIIFLAGCADPGASTDSSEPHFITIGADALGAADDAVGLRLPGSGVSPLEVRNGIALLEYDAQDFLQLSTLMHDHHRCSGFMVHDTIADAQAALGAPPEPLAVSYTLDHAKSINVLMSELRASSILGLIRELSSFKNRYYASQTGAEAANWLAATWTSYASHRPDVTVTPFTHSDFEQSSVILTIPGSTLANEVVIVGAHLDSIAPGGSSSTAPGADDDASGIATLSEVVRVLLARDYRPQRTVQFIGYAAEEVGLVGSQAIAADYQARGINVVGVLQLDMTNYKGSDKDIWLITDYTNPAQNTFIENLIDSYTGATRGVDACGYACSDHASWHKRGFAASIPAEANMDEFNQTLHTPQDTLEVSDNNADHAVRFARLGVAYVAELAKGTIDTSNELVRDDFEAASWTTTGLWHRTTSSTCARPGFSSPTHALYFGSDASCNYATGAQVSGTATSPSITGITATSTLRFRYLREVEPQGSERHDVTSVSVIVGSTATPVWSLSSRTASQERWLLSDEISLAQFAGKSIQLRFEFDSVTSASNGFTGWMVDDVVVTH